MAHELDDILQLSREQFLQVILLAQNRFSEFLLAGSRDRQALLRRLFGTERFEDVQARFDERRRHAEQGLGARLATVSARLDEAERLVVDADLGGDGGDDEGGIASEVQGAGTTTADRLAELERAQARAAYRAERRAADRLEAEKRFEVADAALAAAREDQRAQKERDRARAAMARLDAEEAAVAAAKAELARARAAEVLRSSIAAATRAAAAADEAAATENGRARPGPGSASRPTTSTRGSRNGRVSPGSGSAPSRWRHRRRRAPPSAGRRKRLSSPPSAGARTGRRSALPSPGGSRPQPWNGTTPVDSPTASRNGRACASPRPFAAKPR